MPDADAAASRSRHRLAWAGAIATSAPLLFLVGVAVSEGSPEWGLLLGATVALLVFTAARIRRRWAVGLALLLGVLFLLVSLAAAGAGGIVLLPGAVLLILAAVRG